MGHSACMTTIYTRARFSPQVQLDLPLGFAACLSKNPAGVSIRICNPINENSYLTFAAEKSLQKLYIYLIELQSG